MKPYIDVAYYHIDELCSNFKLLSPHQRQELALIIGLRARFDIWAVAVIETRPMVAKVRYHTILTLEDQQQEELLLTKRSIFGESV